jgi:hypothetical protein
MLQIELPGCRRSWVYADEAFTGMTRVTASRRLFTSRVTISFRSSSAHTSAVRRNTLC